MNDFSSDSEDSDGFTPGRKMLLAKAQELDGSESEEEEITQDQEESEIEQEESEDEEELQVIKKENKQRVLILASRGITHRYRHLMSDLNHILPHSKKEQKFDSKAQIYMINEIAELGNCNNCIYFETRRHQDLYIWMSKTPNGPSIKFHTENVNTTDELRMTGNSLKGSRHILSFDSTFDDSPHLQLTKEILTHIFAVPKTSRKVKPFIDHVLSFSVADNRIWFRNYQIVEKQGEKSLEEEVSLIEIGPRFCMNIMRIFKGSFGGPTLYENPEFVSPNDQRRDIKRVKKEKLERKVYENENRNEKMKHVRTLPSDPSDAIFA